MKHYALTLLLLVFVVVLGGFFFLRDKQAPNLTLTPESGPVSLQRAPLLVLEDPDTGLKSLQVTAIQGDRTVELLRAEFPRGTAEHRLELDLRSAELQEGAFRLEVRAGDHALLANRLSRIFDLQYDPRPPVISVLTRAHNVNQGGAGLVLYRVNKEVERSGVEIGDLFFPGYLQEDGFYASLFTFPYNMTQAEFTPRVLAVDRAGNERRTGFFYHTNPRPPRQDRITISQAFLDSKMPEFQHLYPDTEDLLEVFLRVNRELRAQDLATVAEVSRQTASSPRWRGTFLRLPNAANRAGFNEQRDYFFGGRKIDRQTHLGIDLASVANAPIPAANHGTVVFADDLGIYGNCVIIDHGLGLQSLYSHLSTIDVAVGDRLERGAIIGRTGTTGMAVGDHLHFEVTVAGISVNPLEWWDPNWIRHNFTDKWEAAAAQ